MQISSILLIVLVLSGESHQIMPSLQVKLSFYQQSKRFSRKRVLLTKHVLCCNSKSYLSGFKY